MFPYPLNVQARPPQDQNFAVQSRVSGQEGRGDERDNFRILEKGLKVPKSGRDSCYTKSMFFSLVKLVDHCPGVLSLQDIYLSVDNSLTGGFPNPTICGKVLINNVFAANGKT